MVITLDIVISVVILLLLANSSLFISKKVKIPFAVILVIFGLIIRFTIGDSYDIPFSLTPEILFFVLLPVLLFESAFKIDYRALKKDLTLIGLLATVGVIVSSALVGILFSILLRLPLPVGLVFATIISSTDPIAVISIFKELGVSKRLIQIIDSESMLNDGTSVILAKSILSFLTVGIGTFTVFSGAAEFVYMISASLLIGGLGGYIASNIIKYVKNDFLIEISTTIALAYLVFILTEETFKASGIIATVVSGIVVGNYGRDKFSPQVKHLVKEIWEYFAFIANSFVFLLIGITFNLNITSLRIEQIFLAYFIVSFGRAFSVYSIGLLRNLASSKKSLKIPLNWLHVLNWGGLRGALPIAVVLFLPSIQPENVPILNNYFPILLNYTVGVVLLSLLINGLTIKPLIRLLQVDKLTLREQIESDLVKVYVLNKAIQKIKHLEKIGEINGKSLLLNSKYLTKFKKITRRLKMTMEKYSIESTQVLYNFTFNIERQTFISLHEKGIINDDILGALEIKLLEGIDLIEEGVFPKDFKKAKVMQNIAAKSKKNFDLQQLFLYRKAREFGNLEVLERLKTFENIPILSKSIHSISKAYQTYYEKNRRVCADLESECGQQLKSFEEKICDCEFLATEENIIHQLEVEGKMSPTALKDVQVALVGYPF